MTLPGQFSVRLTFHGDLDFFLKGADGRNHPPEIVRSLIEPASAKDVIESCGVPHPEVDRIIADGVVVDFTYVLRNNCSIDVYSVGVNAMEGRSEPLQRRRIVKFVADGHLGKLTRDLRLLGFDVAYDNRAEDGQLLKVMQAEERALLTRDRRLLMHSVVRDGYCPRSHQPAEQTLEVLRRFELARSLAPFTRCLKCNGPLEDVEKAQVFDRLEPLTRIYYDEFRRCVDCGKIYWRGSHFAKLEATLQRVLGQCSAQVS